MSASQVGVILRTNKFACEVFGPSKSKHTQKSHQRSICIKGKMFQSLNRLEQK